MKRNSREIALKILNEVTEKDAYSNLSINKNIGRSVSDLDASFIRELVYGVLENKIYIDYVIRSFSKVRLKRIEPVIMNILRIGIYQMLFMDRIPDSAAVNESVNLAKIYANKGSHGFTNGILRNISRNKDKIELPDKSKDGIKYLSVKYSHPEWMIERWKRQFNFPFAEELVKANNKRPKLNIRTNTLKISRDELIERLEARDLVCKKTSYARDGIIIENPVNIINIEEFKEGLFQIQDESSMLVSQIMDPKEGSLVVDVCSAPGGKTTHLAQIMNNKGTVLARDIYDHKLKLIDENSKRLGIDIIKTEEYDATKLDKSLLEKADYTLVDAPCSGLGLIRRKPDIKWNKKESDIDSVKQLQLEILETSSKYVKKGGRLIYSTCTIDKEENINLIKRFLSENDDFELVDFKDLVDNSDEIVKEKGYLELFPHINHTDGFFICKMVKK